MGAMTSTAIVSSRVTLAPSAPVATRVNAVVCGGQTCDWAKRGTSSPLTCTDATAPVTFHRMVVHSRDSSRVRSAVKMYEMAARELPPTCPKGARDVSELRRHSPRAHSLLTKVNGRMLPATAFIENPTANPLIQSDPDVMLGKPVVYGTRITVELVVRKLSCGESIE